MNKQNVSTENLLEELGCHFYRNWAITLKAPDDANTNGEDTAIVTRFSSIGSRAKIHFIHQKEIRSLFR